MAAREVVLRSAVLFLLAGCTAGSISDDIDDTDPPASSGSDWLGVCDLYDAHGELDGVEDLEALDSQLEEAVKLGPGLSRAHRFAGGVFAWNLVEPDGATTQDWSLPDHVVTETGRQGIPLLGTIRPLSAREPGEEMRDTIHPAVPPERMEDWKRFVRDAVERYDGDGTDDLPGLVLPIDAWEIGNEPHCEDEGVEACIDAYVELVAETAAAIREAHPDAIVLPGGSAPFFEPGGAEGRGALFYRAFFELGGGDHVDAFGFHISLGDSWPPLEEHIAAWSAHTDLPLWLTETGTHNVGFLEVAPDAEGRAEWFVEHLQTALDGGIEQAMWCRAQEDLARDPEVLDAVLAWLAEEAPAR